MAAQTTIPTYRTIPQASTIPTSNRLAAGYYVEIRVSAPAAQWQRFAGPLTESAARTEAARAQRTFGAARVYRLVE